MGELVKREKLIEEPGTRILVDLVIVLGSCYDYLLGVKHESLARNF